MFTGLIAFYGAPDLDATHRFYHELLGLPLYKDQGVCRIYEVPGGGMVGFCQHMKVAIEGKSPIITFLTDDVDGVYAHLEEAGVHADYPPKENPRYNIYHFFVRDPNGYAVEIQRFL